MAEGTTHDEPLIKLSGSIGDPPLQIGYPNLPPKLPFETEESEASSEEAENEEGEAESED